MNERIKRTWKDNKIVITATGIFIGSLLSWGIWVTDCVYCARAEEKGATEYRKAITDKTEQIKKDVDETKKDVGELRKEVNDNHKEILKILIDKNRKSDSEKK